MGLFSSSREFFDASEAKVITDAIREAEHKTSGEIRVFIESHCKYVDAIDRAKEIFVSLKMTNTVNRNGVLIYLAHKDRQAAIVGDDGIHQKMHEGFWQQQVTHMLMHFGNQSYTTGITNIIEELGSVLQQHFPYNSSINKNELPDDIVFGD